METSEGWVSISFSPVIHNVFVAIGCCFFQTLQIQEVVPQTQTSFVTVASASSRTWCATTRPTAPMDLTSWTVVGGDRESPRERLLSGPCSTCRCRSPMLERIFRLPGSCDFNLAEEQWEETCQLGQNSDDDFDWRMSRRSALPPLGPYVDHSPGQFSHWFHINAFTVSGTTTPSRDREQTAHVALLCERSEVMTMSSRLFRTQSALYIDISRTKRHFSF